MARGVRKSMMEKLQEELLTTQETLTQYEHCLKTLKEKEQMLEEQIEVEELKSLLGLLKEQDISIESLKEIIVQHQGSETCEQSA